jgi:hypothetical protein
MPKLVRGMQTEVGEEPKTRKAALGGARCGYCAEKPPA